VSSRDDSLSKGDEEEEEVLLMASVWRGVAGRRDDDDDDESVEARRRVCVGSFDSVRKKERGRCERGGGTCGCSASMCRVARWMRIRSLACALEKIIFRRRWESV
jgi:hypothetical protein